MSETALNSEIDEAVELRKQIIETAEEMFGHKVENSHPTILFGVACYRAGQASLHPASAAPVTDETALSGVDQLRANGWTVAVHNDYRLNGKPYTFWLWTHPDGRYVKGEGLTDDEALRQVRAAIRQSAKDGE